ncbi:MAG: hypothetical protein KME03_07115 [Aphanocapsa lilacina HA4352-LM1]|jgi:hypothetical protein|nr:hypothetical protein [Aphanocapsa lilacina HA4352-LM1]
MQQLRLALRVEKADQKVGATLLSNDNGVEFLLPCSIWTTQPGEEVLAVESGKALQTGIEGTAFSVGHGRSEQSRLWCHG